MKTWWKEGIAYQAYVRSFKDSDGDGIGDLRGIIEKIDYFKALGVDILYLNPINKSPNEDNGYDISDFTDVMDEYGNLSDLEELISKLHEKNIKLIMDLVVNHSSDEHPWFIESKKSKDNPYRDYYIWQKGKGDKPPNNWGSFFGGSAWEYDEATKEYYLHIFSKKQPDFNWRNKSLREEIKNIIKFWMKKGVDGFRMDAINHIEKDHSFPSGKVKKGQIYGDFIKYIQNLPEVHKYLKELRKELFTSEKYVLIGETGGVNYENAFLYTGKDREELDMIFHFDMHSVGIGEEPWITKPINLVADIKEKMSGWQLREEEEGWCPLFYSNHDTTRTVSRIGNDCEYLRESAKMLATLQFTQRGTPFIYYGDEIGMTNPKNFKIEDYRDISVFQKHEELVKTGLVSEENYMDGLYNTERDNGRTPMQWNNSKNAGFTTGQSWIKVNSNYEEINVDNEIKDENSILNYYKKLIELRKSNEALVYGSFKEVYKKHKEIYAYIRELKGEKFFIIVNFFKKNPTFKFPDEISKRKLILSNYSDLSEKTQLRPYEARIYKMQGGSL